MSAPSWNGKIEATDRETGRLVYDDLYGVSDDEIRIVEAATGASIGSLPVPSPRRGGLGKGDNRMYRDKAQRNFARRLRNQSTSPEKCLWHFLRAADSTHPTKTYYRKNETVSVPQ
jgi:hypothetical protein